MAIHGGGPTHVVIDPVDGSLNAKRGLPFSCVSIAVASGDRMADVEVGWVAELAPSAGTRACRARLVGRARRGRLRRRASGCPQLEPGPLEMLGLETARPGAGRRAWRPRWPTSRRTASGRSARSRRLCLVAAGQLDAMVSLRAGPLRRRRGRPADRPRVRRRGGLPGRRRARPRHALARGGGPLARSWSSDSLGMF